MADCERCAELEKEVERLKEENRQQRLDWQKRQDEYESQLRGADLTLDALRKLKGPDQAAAVAYVHPETGHGSATGANQPNYEMTAYVVDWKQRAEAAEKLVYDLSIERDDFLLRAQNAEAKVLQLGIEKDAEEYRANVSEAERDRLAWMLERIRDSEYDRMSDADALADLAARYDARHEGGDDLRARAGSDA